MEKNESSCSILRSLNLDDIEETLSEAYHQEGAGRPPRKPIGIFKALVVKRLKQIPSDRELFRRLWNDENLREVCDIEEHEKPYHPSQLTRFRNRVGVERLEKIMSGLVGELIKDKLIASKQVVFDATFVKAYSRRDSHDNSKGASDPEARVGRNGKTYDLGYKLHVAVDAKSELPLAVVAAPANDNEKKHSLTLLERAKHVLKNCGAKMRSLIADSQYSDGKIRAAVDKAVIPYQSNQKPGDRSVLRVDKKFRTYGPEDQKNVYHKRPHIEAVNSFLKTQFCMVVNKVRSLKQVATYALLSIFCLVLNREAAQNIRRKDKEVSPTYFNT